MPLKILIVEDDDSSLELMTEVLSSVETEVRPVNDSLAAAAIILKERFDGIFLDLNMPKLDGFALMSRIRESPSNKSTPIIVVTGEEMYERGDAIHSYVVKGEGPEVLIARLKSIVNSKSIMVKSLRAIAS